ncbi:hypothetical protein GCM10009710_36950 [Aeromicrobium alkaliterrae]|uniref:Uncharacterized protein n=1 Tax=Aeromicrobium alkaliterrae TaxID=302168 RepID=A0ABN2KEI5_9ACTN
MRRVMVGLRSEVTRNDPDCTRGSREPGDDTYVVVIVANMIAIVHGVSSVVKPWPARECAALRAWERRRRGAAILWAGSRVGCALSEIQCHGLD